MSDWPADAEQIERARQTSGLVSGSGQFALTTTSWGFRGPNFVEFTMTHRFQFAASLDEFAEFARGFGLRVEVVE